jgi:tetratricopeptide (TPR) repeat protein
MTATQRTTVVATACLAASMGASILLLRSLGQFQPKRAIDDVLYLDSPKIVKRASLGFNGLMACIYWTRTVQYFGHRHSEHAETFNELAPLLEITTALDPHLFPAYELGASFQAPRPPDGAGEPERAIKLMEYGIANNPDNWRLYYDLGFVYYTEIKNFQKAAEIFHRGSEVPNAHPFMKVMAAQMAEHAGEFATARMLWTATYQSSHDSDIRRNALEHLRSLRVDEEVTHLEDAVTRFQAQNGRLPIDMWELIAFEHLPSIPADPEGNFYQLSLDGHILVEKPDDFPFLTKGTPPGYKPGRPKFHVQD